MKKITASVLQCLSIILIIFGIQSVSQNDVMIGKVTIDNTFVFDINIFDSIANGDRGGIIGKYSVLFWLALIILLIASIITYKASKTKSVIMIVLNIIFIAGIILCFTNCNYIMMMILVSVLVAVEIFILGWSKTAIGIIASGLSVCIGILNVFFLIKHLSMANYFTTSSMEMYNNFIEKLVNISRINLVCFGLFVIPCVINLINQIVSKHNDSKTL